MSQPVSEVDVELETTSCPLCGDSNSQPIGRFRDLLYGMPGEFTIARCATCQHVFLNPRPTRDSIGKFYVADYGPFRGAVRRPSSRRSSWLKRFVLWWIDSRAAELPKELSELPNARVIEIGCATGAYLETLQHRGWSCRGVEPSESAAKVARERGLDVRVGSLEEAVTDRVTFSDNSFDAIFAWMVVEHLHDPVGTMRLARELLKPGGFVLFSVPNFGCWERSFFGRFWYALQLPTHLQHFEPQSVKRLLDATGLKLVELIHQRNVNNLVGSFGLWLRTKFPRSSLGDLWIRWTDHPTALGLCLLTPVARLLALIGQSGRLTVIARRPQSESHSGSAR